MRSLHAIAAAYRTAWTYLAPFTAIHLVVRLLAAAVIVPLSGLVLAAALALRGETALTDQDIAGFLLTPAGFVGALTLVALSIIAAVLDLAVMTNTLRRGDHGAAHALLSGLFLILGRFAALFGFGIQFTLRVLLIAAPFLAAAALVAWAAIGDYDINYYLTHKPPVFLAAAGVIGALALGLALVLLMRLSRWAVALHFVLFKQTPANLSFAQSDAGLKRDHLSVAAQVLAWGLVRVLLATLVTTAAGLLVAGAQYLFGTDLRLLALATIAVLLAWWLAEALVSALANGALAVLLDRFYQSASDDRNSAAAVAGTLSTRALALSSTLLISVAVVFVIGGATVAGNLLTQVSAENNVEVIAHRGAAAARPENTLSAVVQALEDRADWVEIDVQETADGEVVVAHDSDFMKQAGVPLKVWDANLNDLAEIDIGSWFDPAYASERTTTLREVLLAAKGRGKVLIELKYYGHDVSLEERVARVVDETDMAGDVASMSLKRAGVEKMQQVRPDWPHGILAATAIGDLSVLDADFLALNTGQVSLPLIRRAHAQGKKVYAWTVDDPVTMARLISIGVDGLITNEPARARTVIEIRNGLSAPERLMLWLSGQFRPERLQLSADVGDA